MIFTLFFIACNSDIVETPNQDIDESRSSEIVNSRSISMYNMPGEDSPHEGTWLTWPHQYQYGTTYRNRLDATWVAMTKALVSSEKVFIIAYNASEKARIITLLTASGVPLVNVSFSIFQTNDVWIRDNGPIYVKDSNNQNKIQDWGFNGWGLKAPYTKDNPIPTKIATSQNKPIINLNNSLILEGGAFEIDGNGTFLATKSAILNPNRNPNISQTQAEQILTQYLGVTNFVWLNGVADLDITDMHIDGFARFANSNTLVTMNVQDLLYWEVPQNDISKLYAAKNVQGVSYTIVKLPLTKNNVATTYGKNLGYKGSYVNFYTANNVVLVPFYNDPNDAVAKTILQNIFPGRNIIGIDCRNLYANGGMIHCVTQQQPI